MRAEKVIVGRCLLLKPSDRFLIICDEENSRYGLAVKEEADRVCNHVLYVELEEYCDRPISSLPGNLKDIVVDFKPTASCYMATSKPGEVSFRIELIRLLVHELNARHAHMPGLDEKIWKMGLAVDYEKVEEITLKVIKVVEKCSEIRVKSPLGTEITARFGLRWVPDTGVFREQGKFGNLPAGEVFTCPVDIEGVFTAEILGDYFVKYGRLKKPATFEIEEGRVVSIRGEDRELVRELEKYIFEGPENADRVGEFAIGTNIFLREPIGNLLQDEKLPGVHIAVGDPYPEETGANWSCSVHLDLIALNTTVYVDGFKIMEGGKFRL